MFTPPARAERIRAVGPVAGLPPALQRALDEQGFDPIPWPGPNDWLASHPEPGQTFTAFLAGRPPRPAMARRVLYLHRSAPLIPGRSRRWICWPVSRRPSSRCSPRDQAGVYSFARYLPPQTGAAAASLLLRRSCKVLAHETAHLLGIAHCVFYSCLMNGSNHLAESDARPLHPCPVDLRKLQHSLGFDVAARYRRLRTFAEDADFADEARWLAAQLLHVGHGAQA